MISKKYKQGFTLMETLVAILVLSVALGGPLTIAHKSLQVSLTSKNQTTAFFLAQDAIEFIRFARDTNCLASGSPANCPAGSWLALAGTTNLSPCVSASGATTCNIDTAGAIISASTGLPLNYNSNNNTYTYSTGAGITASIFTRTISIKTPVCGASCNNSEALVTVTISWRDPIQHSVTLRENIFNWQ